MNADSVFINIFNSTLITFSIIFFYLIPFLFTKIFQINKIFSIDNLLISLFIFFILAFNFDYKYELSGGGIFFKVSYFIFENNYLFLAISLISIFFILPILRKNKSNLLFFLLILLNNPQYTIYHKYFDPFLLITFLTIFYFNIDLKKIFHAKNHLFIFAYFAAFLIISNLKLIYV